MKTREILKMLRDDGWILDRASGSHHAFVHPVKPGIVTVAIHAMGREIAPGTLASILKTSGVEEMTYAAIFERAADGTIWGYSPDIPGATGSGDTIDEARASLQEGVRLWIEVARERGVAVPEPSHVAVEALEALITPAA